MSSIAPNSLFSPEGAVLKDPADVERALAEMWEPAGQKAGVEESGKTVTRVSVANLVVVAGAGEQDELPGMLAELSGMVPARTLVLLIAEGPDEPAEITASVSALCRVPEEGEAQVCSEQIMLHAARRHADRLDETLLALLESDVPVMGWWRLDPGRWPGLFAAIRAMTCRLVVDAGPAGLGSLVWEGRCAVRELSWYRTYPWREQVARMFDECGPEVIEGIERVSVEMRGDSVDEQVDAGWLIGFLAGQLGWQAVRMRSAECGMRNGRGHRRTFEFRSDRGGVEVEVRWGAGSGCGLRSLAVASGTSTFEVQEYANRPEEYRLITCDDRICQMPRSVQVTPASRSQALAAALAGRRVDAAFERARSSAEWVVNQIANVEPAP